MPALYNHHLSFNNEQYECNTHLSKYILELKTKRANINYKITVVNDPAYHPTRRKCDLCLTKIVLILTTNDILNDRTEIL